MRTLAPALEGRRTPIRFHTPDRPLSAHERLARAAVLDALPGEDADWPSEEMSMPWTAHPPPGGSSVVIEITWRPARTHRGRTHPESHLITLGPRVRPWSDQAFGDVDIHVRIGVSIL